MEDYLTPEFIIKQKEILMKHKTQILNKLQVKNEELFIAPEDTTEEGDQAQAYIQQDFAFQLKQRELERLREIENALQRIEDGSYGLCEESGEPIEKIRLERQPWARLSLYYAELEEKERKQYMRRGE